MGFRGRQYSKTGTVGLSCVQLIVTFLNNFGSCNVFFVR